MYVSPVVLNLEDIADLHYRKVNGQHDRDKLIGIHCSGEVDEDTVGTLNLVNGSRSIANSIRTFLCLVWRLGCDRGSKEDMALCRYC